jgi:hypothetical protein
MTFNEWLTEDIERQSADPILSPTGTSASGQNNYDHVLVDGYYSQTEGSQERDISGMAHQMVDDGHISVALESEYVPHHSYAPPEADINRESYDSRPMTHFTQQYANPQSESAAPEPYLKPTNFDENRTPIKPKGMLNRNTSASGVTESGAMRAISTAQSDYYSEFGASDYGSSVRYSQMSRPTTSILLPEESLTEEALAEMTGIGAEDVRQEIRHMLQDADLNSVTRRKIKNRLFMKFGSGIEHYDEFVNTCIEEFTLEKLALV